MLLCLDAIFKLEERLVVADMEAGHVCFVHVALRSNVTVCFAMRSSFGTEFTLCKLDAM